MRSVPVVVLGCGGVGRQLLRHIVSSRSFHSKQGVRLLVLGICDSNSFIAVNDFFTTEISDNLLLELCRVKSEGSSFQELTCYDDCSIYRHPESESIFENIVTSLGRTSGLVVVDCSASSATVRLLKRVVDLGCCVVLANKKPLTSSMDDFDKLMTHPRRIRHESTVGAGLPVIVTLNRIVSSDDTIHRILGSLSGTLGYVMSEVETGKPFSQVVRGAKILGYTEPDPRDDLSGADVARKALIIARLLGRRINMRDIKIESLYPEELSPDKMTVDDFLEFGLPLLDKSFQEKVEKASLNSNVLRYICVIDESRCEVGIREIPKSSAMGRLKGSDNVIEIYSRCYDQRPLVIQGCGAGNDTTAMGVLADIIDLQDFFR